MKTGNFLRQGFFAHLLCAAAQVLGCSSAQHVPLGAEPPPLGHATIHVYRPSYLIWSLRLPVYDGEIYTGNIWARSRLVWTRPEGEMTLRTFESDVFGVAPTRTVTVEAGGEYWFRLQPVLGLLRGGGTFTPVSPERGKRGRGKTRQAEVRAAPGTIPASQQGP